MKNCEFRRLFVDYLGHRIDEHGLHPLPDKTEAIQGAPSPQSVKELKSYLGLLTYYGKFLPHLSSTLFPLYRLLRKDTAWRWTKAVATDFEVCSVKSYKYLQLNIARPQNTKIYILLLLCNSSPSQFPLAHT